MSAPHLSTVKAAALSTVRRGRPIAWTPDFMGFGNHLYLLLWAAQGHWRSEPRFVRSTAKLLPWLEVFPGLSPLVVLPQGVRFTDRRLFPWSQRGETGLVERGYTDAERDAFVREFVLPGSQPPDLQDRLTVNVRRGDYYSDPGARGEFGFDVESYLGLAIPAACSQRSPKSIMVVSDDPQWCASALGWVRDLAPTTFSAPDDSPSSNFWDVASSRQLVITNSTFSYWAAYVSNVRFGGNHSEVWAPRFFSRISNGGRSWQLDERWSVIEDIPNGWDDQG